jgi:hypothetical protein
MDYEKEYEDEEYGMMAPLNWDSLVKNDNVWSVIKDEIEKKFGPECMMRVITAAKQEGMKDDKVFLPMPKIEVVSLFKSSIDEDL